ncbi:uncharacterized protein LOC131803498 [Musca domestica]|uniref:Uncharacterized protein LOC101892330 n=2 Tax=Musca domestica TaxID=7370 RepID=A0ABM3UZK0_MUSDO|nr:uncharacterized protein LOC101892330 [Musca domestica]XP_058978940.1 uncharacterized protein LOC131802608 [Musca domestica]XP_058980832.1 uncharacterized protein LOC131803498 [Musca domestica]
MSSEIDRDTVIALMAIHVCLEEKKNKEEVKKRKHSIWMKQWYAKRQKFTHTKLLKELKESSRLDLKNFLRMDAETYAALLNLVAPEIHRQDTTMREAISANERLSATLRFLASGQSYEDLKFLTGISPQSLGRIVFETCGVIIKILKPYIKMPTNEDEWKDIANEFENQWNFINCIGAIDGKHVHIKKPKTSGSYYFNYKKTFSIVLLAVVNANYEFICVEVGANGRASDAGVFAQSEYKRRYDEQSLRIPKPRQIKNASYELPYVLVGDDAFPLSSNLMKPYSRQKLEKEHLIFNYRLSRARRIVENAFGIISSRFRILLNTISLQPEKASVIVLCCCYLHNYLSKENARVYLRGAADPDKMSDQQMDDLKPLKGSNYTDDAKEIREHFREYFNTIGAVPWQNDRI